MNYETSKDMFEIKARTPQGEFQYLKPKDRLALALSRYESRRTLWGKVKAVVVSSLLKTRDLILGPMYTQLYLSLKRARKLNNYQTNEIVSLKAKLSSLAQEYNSLNAYINEFLDAKYKDKQ